ncbi:hypothetical protein [Actinocorallia longicatena]|uniref:Uncharacterized protein n=1 Tax=Actinocorallia longicatena TaxID=111803 RepID=A0ABP6Q5U7_9ACTN
MADETKLQAPAPATPADRSEAIYGSVLAASVIAAQSPAKNPPSAPTIIATLLATATVFWLVHVYCRVIGGQRGGGSPPIRPIMVEQAPVLYAALPPVLGAVLGWILGLRDAATAWLCLSIAVIAMVCWSIEGAVAMGVPHRVIVRSGLVSTLLGLVMIGLKAALGH